MGDERLAWKAWATKAMGTTSTESEQETEMRKEEVGKKREILKGAEDRKVVSKGCHLEKREEGASEVHQGWPGASFA